MIYMPVTGNKSECFFSTEDPSHHKFLGRDGIYNVKITAEEKHEIDKVVARLWLQREGPQAARKHGLPLEYMNMSRVFGLVLVFVF